MSEMRDRGTIKWTSIMMPEHIKMLNDMWNDKEKKRKPFLDEQQLEEIGVKLQLAIHNDSNTEIKYYANHDFHTLKGKLYKINQVDRYLTIDNYERTRINLIDILDVYID